MLLGRVVVGLGLSILVACAPNGTTSASSSSSAGASPCGNGAQDDQEACDDGNTAAGDGCSATCTVEDGFACSGTPSTCVTTCGDGVAAGAEECDDGGSDFYDGCDGSCHAMHGFTCTGSPSVCSPRCGDGLVAGTEACDDGNTMPGDGCSDACAPEGFCEGEPSVCAPVCTSVHDPLPITTPRMPMMIGTTGTFTIAAPPSGTSVVWLAQEGFAGAWHRVGEGNSLSLTVNSTPTNLCAILRDDATGCMEPFCHDASLRVQDPTHVRQQPLADIAGYDENNQRVALSSFRGKYMIVDFCTEWCAACQFAVNPFVEEMSYALRSAGLDFVWVQLLVQDSEYQPATAETVRRWRQQGGLSGQTVVLHPNGQLGTSMDRAFAGYGLPGYPALVYVDPEGKVYAYYSDYEVVERQEILNIIAEQAGITPPQAP